ncbi:phenylacetate--CoA ligase family protein [Niveibacterium umoris]|uniref:Phenylacetate-CoA ligase n=1 Tax=Niveibacterium umoris TaxID=1193620 RepID=A0A840BQA1_9RHOO|nr:phenylacetate--CoA ligase family protein [Niveibacterium umoris]MBB4013852.1 phenylacetate-CoA ligase [Niveibacterium umoris]
MNHHYDALESRPPALREAALMARLPRLVALAQTRAPAFARMLREVDAAGITSRAALAQLPVLRKSMLLALQKQQPPFGGCATAEWGPECARVFASPGPIHEPEAPRRDYWRTARALHAAGFRAGMLVHNTFSYHFTPAGSMLESGAHALGCTVFPAGTGQTELQLQTMAALQPHAYVGTPSFLRILLERGDQLGLASPRLKHAAVSGEAFPPALRDLLANCGIEGFQIYATADLGTIAYETAARDGLVVEEDAVVEIVRPGTGDPVADGDIGEVVVTVFNPTYPLIRYGTGDLSRVLPGTSPCGRTNMRLAGWLGRADQSAKIRGMFVHPVQINEVLRRFSEVRRARLVVDNPEGPDRVRLQCEATEASAALADALAVGFRDVTKLRAEIQLLDPGTLPDDGKLIDDQRRFD